MPKGIGEPLSIVVVNDRYDVTREVTMSYTRETLEARKRELIAELEAINKALNG